MMLKQSSLLLFCLLLSGLAFSQDTYHSNLQSSLQSNHSLPAGTWMFFDNESDIMNGVSAYGSSSTTQAVAGQDFSLKSRIIVSQAGSSPFSSGWTIRNKVPVQTGDVILAVFYLRSEGGPGKVNFFVEHPVTYVKESFFTMPIDTQWNQYLIPFQSGDNYGVEGLTFGFHLGFQAQTIEVGGFTAIQYGTSAALDDLPEDINNEFYEGWEANAPWRAMADARIDQYRKANLSIEAKNTSGQAVSNAGINVRMLQHEFAFGSAITASRIAGNNASNLIYENKIINLDGQGHGFNWVVFENDMKWPAWESEWFVNKAELVNAVSWLVDHNIKIRGHTLLWPGAQNMPADIGANFSDLPYVKSRIENHIETVLTYPGIEGQVDEWDALNEIITNDDLENAFQGAAGYPTGREILAEACLKAQQTDSTIGLWVNDYITISQQQEAGAAQYDELKSHIQELLDAGVNLEGIGFQSHIGGFPNGIPSVLNTLDDFYNTFGLKAKMTEFDTPSFVDESLGADYLRDYLTATFSHPSVDGFLFWNFWDGATWLNEGSNLFRLDWSMTPAGSTFVDLLFDEWWTDVSLATDAAGMTQTRAFKGLYEISYTCDGVIVRDTVNIVEDLNLDIVCDAIAASLNELPVLKVDVYPNPTRDQLLIQQEKAIFTTVKLFDISGRLLLQRQTTEATLTLGMSQLIEGVYVLELTNADGQFREKIVKY